MIRSWFVPPVSLCVGCCGRARSAPPHHAATGSPERPNPHAAAVLVAASARASYCIHANSSTALELVDHSGSVAAIVALLQSGVSVHTAGSNECTAQEGSQKRFACG